MELTERIKQYLAMTGDGARVAQLRDSLAEPGPVIMSALAELGDDVFFADDGRWYLVNPYIPSSSAVVEFYETEFAEPEPVFEPEPQPEPVIGKPETFDLMVAELAEIAEELKADIPKIEVHVVKEPKIPVVNIWQLSEHDLAKEFIQKYGSGKTASPSKVKQPKPIENPVMTDLENPILTELKKIVGADKPSVDPVNKNLSLEMWQVLREWLQRNWNEDSMKGLISWPLTVEQLTDRGWRGKTVGKQRRDTVRAINGIYRWGTKDDLKLLKATISDLDSVLVQPAAPVKQVKEVKLEVKPVKPVKQVKATKVVKAKAPSKLIELLEMTPADVVIEAELTPPVTTTDSAISDDIKAIVDRLAYCNKLSMIKFDTWTAVCLGLDGVIAELGLPDGSALRSELKAMASFYADARTA